MQKSERLKAQTGGDAKSPEELRRRERRKAVDGPSSTEPEALEYAIEPPPERGDQELQSIG